MHNAVRTCAPSVRLFALLLIAAAASASAAEKNNPRTIPIRIPGGQEGIGFDDMRTDPLTGAIFIPAGVTGSVFRIDPTTHALTAFSGFASSPAWKGHDDGPTSVDIGLGYLFVVDRTSQSLDIAAVATQTIVAHVPLGGPPDLVRCLPSESEVWVTEPATSRIEVFDLRPLQQGDGPPAFKLEIPAPGGPQGLVLDAPHGVAYTHLPATAETAAIDMVTHVIRERWDCGCDDRDPQGLVLDGSHRILVTACGDGTLLALDPVGQHELLGKVRSGLGVNIVAYNETLQHIYAPGAQSGTMAVVGMRPGGTLELLGIVPVPYGAHSASADRHRGVYICDPAHGQVVVWHDPFPPTTLMEPRPTPPVR